MGLPLFLSAEDNTKPDIFLESWIYFEEQKTRVTIGHSMREQKRVPSLLYPEQFTEQYYSP